MFVKETDDSVLAAISRDNFTPVSVVTKYASGCVLSASCAFVAASFIMLAISSIVNSVSNTTAKDLSHSP
eukprot:1823560-Prymnesium_polylepis.1